MNWCLFSWEISRGHFKLGNHRRCRKRQRKIPQKLKNKSSNGKHDDSDTSIEWPLGCILRVFSRSRRNQSSEQSFVQSKSKEAKKTANEFVNEQKNANWIFESQTIGRDCETCLVFFVRSKEERLNRRRLNHCLPLFEGTRRIQQLGLRLDLSVPLSFNSGIDHDGHSKNHQSLKRFTIHWHKAKRRHKNQFGFHFIWRAFFIAKQVTKTKQRAHCEPVGRSRNEIESPQEFNYFYSSAVVEPIDGSTVRRERLPLIHFIHIFLLFARHLHGPSVVQKRMRQCSHFGIVWFTSLPQNSRRNFFEKSSNDFTNNKTKTTKLWTPQKTNISLRKILVEKKFSRKTPRLSLPFLGRIETNATNNQLYRLAANKRLEIVELNLMASGVAAGDVRFVRCCCDDCDVVNGHTVALWRSLPFSAEANRPKVSVIFFLLWRWFDSRWTCVLLRFIAVCLCAQAIEAMRTYSFRRQFSARRKMVSSFFQLNVGV